MMATGELQSLAPQLDFLELAKLLRLKVAGEPFPHSFIHELNAYSGAPADLVRGRDPAPVTGQAGDGKGMAWYFYSPVNWHESAGGAPRRNRQVGGGGGGGEKRFWHPEGGEKPILGPDRKPVGAYWRTLSYVLKIKNPPGAKKSFRNKRLGWCMIEIGLQQQDGGAGQLVLCKVYRSPRADAEAIMPGGGVPCPAPFERDNQSMELAMEDGRPVIAENSYSHQAPAGTVITRTRDTTKSILTSIELKRTVTILDIERTSTLDQDAFVLVVKAISIFQSFEDLGISVDWVATSEGKMSFTLVPSQLLSQEVIQPALDKAVQKLQKIATVDRLQDRSVISLIGNPQMSIVILGKALDVLGSNNFTVEKVPRGSPKVANVSLVVHDSAAERCVQLLHSAFFELNGCPVPVNSSGAASSSDKRKADDGHPDAPPGVRQERTNTEAERWVLEELERPLLSDNELNEFFDSVFSYNEMPARVDGGDNNCHIPVSEVEGPEKERPIPVDSSTASSSHAEAPPCGGQDAYHIALQEMEHTFLLSDNNDPMPVGADNVGVQYESINTFWINSIDGGDLDSERPLPDVLYDDDYAVQNGSDEYSEDCDYFMYDEVQFEEQELTEAEESGSELASVTEEMERSHQESTTNHDGRDLGVLSQSGIWEICGWVHRLATFKPSMPSAGHTNSLCSRLAVWLTRFCAKQNSVE